MSGCGAPDRSAGSRRPSTSTSLRQTRWCSRQRRTRRSRSGSSACWRVIRFRFSATASTAQGWPTFERCRRGVAMDELIKELERFKDLTSAFTLTDVALVMALSFVLNACFAAIYRHTHRGTSYSQSFAQALVVMGMVTAVIMLIIGSNIARAFSLVGAMSVIRFRNAVKETRDVAFMFVAMAVGMACGTRFYVLAAFATAVMSAVIVLMHRVNAFERQVGERLLRVRMPPERDPDRVLEPVFRSLLD